MKRLLMFIVIVLASSSVVFAMTYSEAQKQNYKPKVQHQDLECSDCHGKLSSKTQMKAVEKEKCYECHEPFTGSYESEDGVINPHISIHYAPGTMDCKLCHSEHAESRNFCTACHADGLGFTVP